MILLRKSVTLFNFPVQNGFVANNKLGTSTYYLNGKFLKKNMCCSGI